MFQIKDVVIKSKIICGPMAGVTNLPFRKLVKSLGAGLTYTEMTSNVGLKYNSNKTLNYAEIEKSESPVSLQIFGGEIDDYVKAAKFFDQNSNASIIDINMGCPVNKVAIKSNAGSSLLQTPEKIRQIIRAIVREIKKPLTIKIRLGWDQNSLIYLEVAKIAEEEGVAAIAIHGRTRSEFFNGKANWDAIREVKKLVKIPVIGNGDVWTPEDAKAMLEYTNVDAVMVARAAQECPWVIKQMHDYLATGKYDPLPTLVETIDELIKFYNELFALQGERLALAQIKGVITNWLKRFPEAKALRNELVQFNSWALIESKLQIFKKQFN